MQTLLIAVGAGVAFIIAYYTYGRWLGRKIFNLSADFVCPSHRLRDDQDYVPTKKSIVFGHHFTSIAGTGPIVGPAIAVMWGWVPALLWVIFGSIFIGAVHDFGSLVVSLRNNGQTVGDIAGRVVNRRVRILFLTVLFLALTIVLAIFGLVIAAVFRMYPSSIFPCAVQIPIAVLIGLWLHRKGVHLLVPSIIALAVMYLTVIYGDWGPLHTVNAWMASWPTIVWVAVLLIYSYIASVLPVWTLLQPRDYINSLQLISALALIVVGLGAAAFMGGAPPVEGAGRPALEIAAPAVQWNPEAAPLIFPFLFITVACGAISGFHCLVSSGTSSKQLEHEPDARFVGFGAMLMEGFLAVLVILACVAGLGLGTTHTLSLSNAQERVAAKSFVEEADFPAGSYQLRDDALILATTGELAWQSRYQSWTAAGSLGKKVGAFVDGSGNFLRAIGIPAGVAVALMGVLVASFAGTTLDTACRLQRYVVQELARAIAGVPVAGGKTCPECGYNLRGNITGKCPECGWEIDWDRVADEAPRTAARSAAARSAAASLHPLNPLTWLMNKHGATLFAIVVGGLIAALPAPGAGAWTLKTAGTGGMILWPMFGATNQLLGGLAFMVIAFWLWRRRKPIWFLVLPLIFMLIMPAWAMTWQLFVSNAGGKPGWVFSDNPQWVLIFIAVATLLLEAWMIVEALLLFPKVRGVLEEQLPGHQPAAEAEAAYAAATVEA